jgi:hypothetical protein
MDPSSAEGLMSAYLNHTATASSVDMQNDSLDDDIKDEKAERRRGGGFRESSGKLGGKRSIGGIRLDVFSKSIAAQRQLACLSKLDQLQDPLNDAEVGTKLIEFCVFTAASLLHAFSFFHAMQVQY